MSFVTATRLAHPWMVYFLPVSGLVIVGSYHLTKSKDNTGTNMVLSAIHSGHHLPVRTAPLIFISTILTHMFGGSVG